MYLLEAGEATPAAIASATELTRTNAYKVLERLEELGLVNQSGAKKLAYRPADPSALASIVAEERNRIIALEKGVSQAMQQLRNKYRKSTGTSSAEIVYGKSELAASFRNHASRQAPIYFVRARADVPFMGYDVMNEIRHLPAKFNTERFGLVPDGPENPINPVVDSRTNLHRTWIPNQDYTSPVEWTVSGDELLIAVFEDSGKAIRITDPAVAESFRQIWHMVDKNVRANSDYKPIAPHARRNI